MYLQETAYNTRHSSNTHQPWIHEISRFQPHAHHESMSRNFLQENDRMSSSINTQGMQDKKPHSNFSKLMAQR
jgi:hypothetical protein